MDVTRKYIRQLRHQSHALTERLNVKRSETFDLKKSEERCSLAGFMAQIVAHDLLEFPATAHFAQNILE